MRCDHDLNHMISHLKQFEGGENENHIIGSFVWAHETFYGEEHFVELYEHWEELFDPALYHINTSKRLISIFKTAILNPLKQGD